MQDFFHGFSWCITEGIERENVDPLHNLCLEVHRAVQDTQIYRMIVFKYVQQNASDVMSRCAKMFQVFYSNFSIVEVTSSRSAMMRRVSDVAKTLISRCCVDAVLEMFTSSASLS